MKLLTTAAMALALAGAAGIAYADEPQQQQQGGEHHGDHGGGQPHEHGGGQHGQGQGGGGPHNGAGGQGGAHNAQGGQVGPHGGAVQNPNAQQWQGRGGHWQGQGGGQPAQGQNVQQWQGREHHDAAGQQHWQGQGGGQPAQGQNVQRWQGGDHHNAGGAQQWQGGQHWQGQRGFGFENHGMRGRDSGRGWYNGNSFAHQYHAQRRFRFSGYRYNPRGWYARSWSFGDVLPFGWYASEYYLDWAEYGLPPPPIGCEWIAEGSDAVLVDIWTGEVLSVYRGIFAWNGY